MLSDDKLESLLGEDEKSVSFDESFEIVVECEDEQHQEAVFNKLTSEGYKCRVLTL
jgi:predicted 3-demethylubiquinone-9 3-methyltransferase (glyoxalase superfamily)